jgi:hypothetical protein
MTQFPKPSCDLFLTNCKGIDYANPKVTHLRRL